MSVIGVLNTVGSSSTSSEVANPDDQAILPLTTASALLLPPASRNSVSQILIQATSGTPLTAAYQETDAELLSLHQITNATEADFTITSEQQVLSTATSVDKTLTVLLGGVAAISLLVGGIGVHEHHVGLGHGADPRDRVAQGPRRDAARHPPTVPGRGSVLGSVGGVLGAALGL